MKPCLHALITARFLGVRVQVRGVPWAVGWELSKTLAQRAVDIGLSLLVSEFSASRWRKRRSARGVYVPMPLAAACLIL